MFPVGADDFMLYPDDLFDYVDQGTAFNPAVKGRSVSPLRAELMSGGSGLTRALIFVGGFERRVATWFIGLCLLQAFSRPCYFLREALHRFVALRPMIARPALIESAAAKVDFGLLARKGLRLLRDDWAAERVVWHLLAPLVGPDGNVDNLRALDPCGSAMCLRARLRPLCAECRPEARSDPVWRNRVPQGAPAPDLGYHPVHCRDTAFADAAQGQVAAAPSGDNLSG